MALCWFVVTLGGSLAVAMISVSLADWSAPSSCVLSALTELSAADAPEVSPAPWAQPDSTPAANAKASTGANLRSCYFFIIILLFFICTIPCRNQDWNRMHRISSQKFPANQTLPANLSAGKICIFFILQQSLPDGWEHTLP